MELLVKNIFTIFLKVEDGNVFIEKINYFLCIGLLWKCLAFLTHYFVMVMNFVYVGA